MKNELILERSTNTHVLVSKSEIKSKDLGNGIVKFSCASGTGYVTHGEHGVLATESTDCVKYVQQELNPVTKKMQNAFD